MTLDSFELDIHNFNIVKQIGTGTISSVYLVEDNKTNQEYVAKIIQLDLDKQSDFIAKHEIDNLIKAQHQTLVKLTGFCSTDFYDRSHLTLILDFYKRGTLNSILKNIQKGEKVENYDNTTRQIILIGIARGMMYLHQQNFIHGNLKTENVLLDDDLHPHLTDFGLFKFYQQFSFPHNFCSPICMAPEVINSNEYSDKTDVYSFGIMMFEIISDSFPYPFLQSGRVPLHTFYQRVGKEGLRPEIRNDLPIKEPMKKLMKKCWADDPNDRPSFENIFNKLAFNDNREENDFYLNDVDVEKVKNYAENVKNE